MVGLRLVDIGNQVTANSSNPLIVNQVQPIYVDFTIPEDSVPAVTAKLKEGRKLRLRRWIARKRTSSPKARC